jgi:hypothetical protein
VVQQLAKLVSKHDKISEIPFHFIELLCSKRSNLATRRAASVSLGEYSRQLFNREADAQRSLNQPDSIDRTRRIFSIAVR